MIFKALSFLAAEVNKFLNLKLGDHTNSRIIIGNVPIYPVIPGSSVDSIDDTVVLSLVNIEESQFFTQHTDCLTIEAASEHTSSLNLYILFTAGTTQSNNKSQLIDLILEFFHHQQVFMAETHPGLPSSVQKLMIERYSHNLKQNVLYKLSLKGMHDTTPHRKKVMMKEIMNKEKSKLPVI